MFWLVFFFKQKTAYEMRISDWSSDVCSSDLGLVPSQKTSMTLLCKTWLGLLMHVGGAPLILRHAPNLSTELSRLLSTLRHCSIESIRAARVKRNNAPEAKKAAGRCGQVSPGCRESGISRFKAGDRKSKRLNSSH